MGTSEGVAFVQNGREITWQNVEHVQEVVRQCASLSRDELALTICEHWDWVAATGGTCQESCVWAVDGESKSSSCGRLLKIERGGVGGSRSCGLSSSWHDEFVERRIDHRGEFAPGKLYPGWSHVQFRRLLRRFVRRRNAARRTARARRQRFQSATPPFCRRRLERVTSTPRSSLAWATRSSRAHSERLGRRLATGCSASRARLSEPNSVSEKRINTPSRRGCWIGGRPVRAMTL